MFYCLQRAPCFASYLEKVACDLHFSFVSDKPMLGAVYLALGIHGPYFLGLLVQFIKGICRTWKADGIAVRASSLRCGEMSAV